MPRIRWKRLADEAQVRAIVLSELPLGTPVAAVLVFLADQRVEIYENGDRIRARARVRRRSLLVTAKWVIDFSFSDAGLAEVAVTMDITGP
jgi:hypothetical protein